MEYWMVYCFESDDNDEGNGDGDDISSEYW